MKRPYTKQVLSRLDFRKIVREISLDELRRTEQNLNLACYVTDSMYAEFQGFVESAETRKGA